MVAQRSALLQLWIRTAKTIELKPKNHKYKTYLKL